MQHPWLQPLLAYLAGVNVLTAAVYAYDKLAARRRRRRVRVRTLWLLCLAGGVLGAWAVFLGMRHKTLHRSFWLVQSLASVLWIGMLVALAAMTLTAR